MNPLFTSKHMWNSVTGNRLTAEPLKLKGWRGQSPSLLSPHSTGTSQALRAPLRILCPVYSEALLAWTSHAQECPSRGWGGGTPKERWVGCTSKQGHWVQRGLERDPWGCERSAQGLCVHARGLLQVGRGALPSGSTSECAGSRALGRRERLASPRRQGGEARGLHPESGLRSCEPGFLYIWGGYTWGG